MIDDNLELDFKPRVLATDLDGTLVPLPGNESNRSALDVLEKAFSGNRIELVFATGRPFESVLAAIADYGLPLPRWIACDVGTSIYRKTADDFEPFDPYQEHLSKRVSGSGREAIEMAAKNITGLQLQSAENQKAYKVSYTCDAARLDSLVDAIDTACAGNALPWRAMGSVDPFEGCGLIDILPEGVTKAYALTWLATHADYTASEVIYAGDSGNDLAALTSGARAIVVGNASAEVRAAVAAELKKKQWSDRLYAAKSGGRNRVVT